MNNFITFLKDWQDLTGAFFGPFLAVILSGVAYLIGKAYEKREKEKEAMRRIEVSTSYSLNSIVNTQTKLLRFVGAARDLIDEVEAETDPRAFSLNTINFPAIGTVYQDNSVLEMPTKSYYIHNKLLWIHSGIEDVNNILTGLREDFARVIRLNEKMLDLMQANPNPPRQREAYAQNLTLFANEIERFANSDLLKGITPLIQVKIYNEKLRKSWFSGARVRWENEGVASWLLRTLFKYEKPKRNLENVDRIDTLLQPEVQVALERMQERARQLEEEQTV